MHADPWESFGGVTCPETITATTVGRFCASCPPRTFPQGGAIYGKLAKSQKLYSSWLPFVAASQEVEKVTLLLNSFPVKAGASPLNTPATRRIPLGPDRNGTKVSEQRQREIFMVKGAASGNGLLKGREGEEEGGGVSGTALKAARSQRAGLGGTNSGCA
ncbi:uncharacterized protein EI90DRAFT_3020052 [Cantharellus anzutake]|uniref:uncharacterized protein n=1 Tax=Cantharellus anzutake TaxID=1750568 RepID=UPI001906D479|nr:uncharacterized protein EI90DRAFT_3020052 [Cantharellus anzutake]KAF8322789.1 hypothetical protein EI90DRAFT_3020052 [Cantharellus anzutake]